MIRNNNQPAVRRLSLRSLKANRARNLIAMCAIILTTFMISTVFSIGISLAKNLAVMTTRMSGTTASIFLTYPTDKDISFTDSLSGVKSTGIQYSIGAVRGKTADGKDYNIALMSFNESEWKNHITPAIGDIEGKYPEKSNEIMLSEKAYKQLFGKKPTIGDKIAFNYECNLAKYSEEFIVCGVYKEYEAARNTGIALLSESFCADKGLTITEDGRLCISCSKFKNEAIYDALFEEIGKERNQNLKSDVTIQSQTSQAQVMTVLAIVIIALFIVLSGYLLIYNIMYISVTKDTRFYGLLKTIGTSPKQIKKIVFRQGTLLSVIGIPTGILLSVFMSFIIVPFAMRAMGNDGLSAMPGDISFNPIIYIGTAVFSLLTVAFSCRKPAKLASRISPVEALKYTGIASSSKKGERKARKGDKLAQMAYHNVFRDKKRAIIVFASLFMGTVTFLCVTSFFSSIDVNNYIDTYHPDDFEYKSTPPLGEIKFDKDFVEALGKIDGVKNKEIIYADYATMPFDKNFFRPVLEDTAETYNETADDLAISMEAMSKRSGYGTWIIAVPDKYAQLAEGVDIDAFRRGEECIIGYGKYEGMIGKTLNLTSHDTGKTGSIKVGGCFHDYSECNYALFSYTVGSVEGVFVSEKFLEKFNDDPVVLSIKINVDEKKESRIKAELTSMNRTLTSSAYTFTARTDAAKEFRVSMSTMNILTGGISLLLILIGIINFINVMMTGIFTRRRELAVLESIGMTKKQLYKMLCLEGGWYALITSGLILTIGNAAMVFIGNTARFFVDYAVFKYPLTTVICLIASIIVISICVPPLVYRLSSSESVTDRLHTVDN